MPDFEIRKLRFDGLRSEYMSGARPGYSDAVWLTLLEHVGFRRHEARSELEFWKMCKANKVAA